MSWCYHHESYILELQFAFKEEYKRSEKLQCMCYDEFCPLEGSAVQTQRTQSKNLKKTNPKP